MVFKKSFLLLGLLYNAVVNVHTFNMQPLWDIFIEIKQFFRGRRGESEFYYVMFQGVGGGAHILPIPNYYYAGSMFIGLIFKLAHDKRCIIL